MANTFLEKSLPFGDFYVEYNGFMSNHRGQGLVALHCLGADEDKMVAFCDWYNEKLEAKDGSTYHSQCDNQGTSVEDLLGKRKAFHAILDHFQSRLAGMYKDSIPALVKGEFPALVKGISAALLHGMVHLGYGLSVDNNTMICEGLAYLHHSYAPLVTSDPTPDLTQLGQGSLDILEVMGKFSQDAGLKKYMMDEYEKEWVTCRKTSYIQDRIYVLLMRKGDAIIDYVNQIKFPAFYNPKAPSTEQLDALLKWLIDCSIVLYQVAEYRNDFVLIHGVTSTWSLAQALPLVEVFNTALEAIRVQLAILLVVYMARDSPPLNLKYLEEPDVLEVKWQDIKSRAVGMEMAGTDEHTYKLIQVCLDMSNKYPDSEHCDLYKRAALSAIELPMYKGFKSK